MRTLVFMLLLAATAIQAEPLAEAGSSQLVFFGESTIGAATPLQWTSCEAYCEPAMRTAEWFMSGDGSLQLTAPDNPEVAEIINSGFSYTRSIDDDATLLRATSVELLNGQALEVIYRIQTDSHLVELSTNSPVPLQLTLTTGSDLIPQQLPGFGAIYSTVRSALFFDGDQTYFELEPGSSESAEIPAESWFGIRNRYWVWYMQPQAATTGRAELQDVNRPSVSMLIPPEGIRIYAGPTKLSALKAADPSLSGVLFSAIWDWLRAISFGLLYLLQGIYSLVGNYGLAIVLLSLAVKILMYPLTVIADRWQSQVNAITSAMKPKLDEIKKNFKGEEAHNKVLNVYKEHNVTPFYTLRSLFGFLIQIPIFIGAFDMLAENFVLGQAGFLWISDLAKPDDFASLPFVLPFFGGQLNLLPFAMTALTILSAIVQEEADLTPDLMRQQRFKLFAMAGAFFLLFYTFPAGMVLYWTANNLFHLLKILPARLMGGFKT